MSISVATARFFRVLLALRCAFGCLVVLLLLQRHPGTRLLRQCIWTLHLSWIALFNIVNWIAVELAMNPFARKGKQLTLGEALHVEKLRLLSSSFTVQLSKETIVEDRYWLSTLPWHRWSNMLLLQAMPSYRSNKAYPKSKGNDQCVNSSMLAKHRPWPLLCLHVPLSACTILLA